ncbi:hypothetical protein HK101_009847 [Irineochytrium annulatum]|nr:hypothetical protein HK101_009847 [Irineochytrium annulatum]
MPRYQRVGEDEEDVLFDRTSFDEVQLVAPSSQGPSGPSRVAVQPSASSSSSASAQPVGTGNDGVFANLSVTNAEAGGKTFDELEPPSYQDAVLENSPNYLDATVVTSFSEDGDVLVEAEAEVYAYRNDPDNFANSEQEQIAMQNEWVACKDYLSSSTFAFTD